MRSRDQLFETLTTEGALLPSDFLQRLAQRDHEIPGISPDAYHLGSGERINEAISRSWNRLLAIWKNFAAAVAELPASDLGTALTREKWLLPFFQELGYGRLSTAKPYEFEGRRCSISHTWQNTPIHLISFRADLDTHSENIIGARTTTPHSMLQEFLNRSEGDLWGVVSNGYRLRLLRDNASLIRAPAKEDHDRAVVRLKGGVTDYFVVGELDVPELREFQSQARSPDKPFKPVPSGFEMASFRQSRPPLNG